MQATNIKLTVWLTPQLLRKSTALLVNSFPNFSSKIRRISWSSGNSPNLEDAKIRLDIASLTSPGHSLHLSQKRIRKGLVWFLLKGLHSKRWPTCSFEAEPLFLWGGNSNPLSFQVHPSCYSPWSQSQPVHSQFHIQYSKKEEKGLNYRV